MRQTGKPVSDKFLKERLIKYLSIGITWLIVISIIPVYSIFDPMILPFGAVIYQVAGIFLLYMDEKYKMRRDTTIFGKINSFLITVIDAPKRAFNTYKSLKRRKKINGSNKSICQFTFDVTVKRIRYDYAEIEDPTERAKAQLHTIDAEIGSLRYFSSLRQFGYLILAIGFILQFAKTF